MGHPAVQAQLLQMPHDDVALWQERLARPHGHDLRLVAELDGQVVGTAGLMGQGWSRRRSHAAAVGIGVLPEAQGRGVGSALMAALCAYADDWAHILRIELTAFADNARAIALYRKHGFEHEGLHRGYALRGGAFVDAVCMARLHPSPPQLPPQLPAAAAG